MTDRGDQSKFLKISKLQSIPYSLLPQNSGLFLLADAQTEKSRLSIIRFLPRYVNHREVSLVLKSISRSFSFQNYFLRDRLAETSDKLESNGFCIVQIFFTINPRIISDFSISANVRRYCRTLRYCIWDSIELKRFQIFFELSSTAILLFYSVSMIFSQFHGQNRIFGSGAKLHRKFYQSRPKSQEHGPNMDRNRSLKK